MEQGRPARRAQPGLSYRRPRTARRSHPKSRDARSLDSKPRLVPHSFSMKIFPPLVLKIKALPHLFNVTRTELAFRWPAGARSKSVITRPPLVLALMSKESSGDTLTRILPA